MDTRIFLRKILPSQGVYVLWCNNTELKRHTRTLSFEDIDELAAQATEYDDKGWDAYFALSAFKEEGTRKATDASHIKALFLDIDVGEDKPHTSKKHALQELMRFCSVLDLPKPILLDSGGGIHTYWAFTEDISITDWKPVAEKFKALCAEHKFLIDTAVPADAARVLRILGTHNYKFDTPVPVKLLQDAPAVDFDFLANQLGCDLIPVPEKAEEVYEPPPDRIFSFKNILAKTQAGRGCEQLRNIVMRQKETAEPMWRAGLSIVKYCENAESHAHNISQLHDEYTPELTKEKFELIKGPYRCATFDELNPDVCIHCPNWGKIKSPISLGARFAPATAATPDPDTLFSDTTVGEETTSSEHVIPSYPRPYFRGASGGIYVRSVGPDGDIDERAIYHNDLYVIKRLVDVEAGESVVCRLHLPKDGVREFTMPLTAVTSREEFRKTMSMQGVAVTRPDDLIQYMTTWVNELQASTTADTAHRQFGWIDDKCSAFVVGDKEIHPNKIRYNPPSTPTAALLSKFEPKGTLDGWKAMANFYTTRPELVMHQYVVCTAFGSPLMHFFPQNACALHLHSAISGCGKTAAIRVAASVWGYEKALMLEERDTDSMKFNRAEVLHNLPFYVDELTNEHSKRLSDLAYQLSSGQQRGRMAGGANLERTRGEPWKFLAVTTGNASVIERIALEKQAPKAEAQRMMEWPAQKVFGTTEEKRDTDLFDEAVAANYGHAGTIYIQHIMQNLDYVRAKLKEVQQRVDTVAGLTSENRFWSAGVACTLTGAIFAKKLGLIDYDTKELFKWSIKLLKHNMDSVSGMGVSVRQTLNEYLNENFNNILMIKSTDDLRKQSNGLDSLVIPDALPKGKLVARYETDIQQVYLAPKPLKVWCAAQQVNYSAFVSDLMKKMGAKRGKVRLTKGTQFRTDAQHVLIVKMKLGGDDEQVVSASDTSAEEGQGVKEE